MKAILNGFRDECELMEADKHANVVQFIGVFDQDGSALLVIKLMDQTLDAFLTRNRGALPVSKLVRISLPPDCAGNAVHTYTRTRPPS